MHRFLVIVERTEGNYSTEVNYSSYSPDLPGCVAKGATEEEVESNIAGTISLNVRGLVEDGLPLPDSESVARYVTVQ